MRILELTPDTEWQSAPPAPPQESTVVPAPTIAEDQAPHSFTKVHYLNCCGIKELHLISYTPPKQVLQDFCFQRTAPEILIPDYAHRPDMQARRMREILSINKFGCAFVLFTQAYLRDTFDGYGDKLSAFIQQNGLGEVTIAGKERNPNSSNIVTAYFWNVNHNALEKWWKANPIGAGHRERLLATWNNWKTAHQL